MKTISFRIIILLSALSFSGAVLAHTGLETGSGIMGGILHPLTGLDHLAFMLAVGIWAARAANRQKWIQLMTVPAFMLIGAVCAYKGISFAGIEISIALSVMITGLFVFRGLNIQTSSVALIGFFALFHGQAHMLEITAMASPLFYSLGFLLTSSSLLIIGLGLGQWLHRIRLEWMIRGLGLLTGGFGAFLLLSAG